jgi:hypothetical protein
MLENVIIFLVVMYQTVLVQQYYNQKLIKTNFIKHFNQKILNQNFSACLQGKNQ